jgi:CHAT domain-containing protein/tetratricopeptide (TPR) repeat protein
MLRTTYQKLSLGLPVFSGMLLLSLCISSSSPGKAYVADAHHSAHPAGKPSQGEPAVLMAGRQIERELKGGETQEFVVDLKQREFLHVDVEQRGIDIAVGLLAPDGKNLLTIDSPNDQYGPELVVWEAAVSGLHKLQVRAGNMKAPTGIYQIKVVALGAATPANSNLIMAARAFETGWSLRSQRTAPSRLAAIKNYERALSFFVAAGDQYWQALTLNTIGSTYAQSSEFRKALNAFSQALPLFQAVGDKRREAGTLNYMGGVRDVLGDQTEALDYYSRALKIYEQVEDRSTKASILNNIGKIYTDLGQWQAALDYYNQALPILRVIADQRREAIALHNLGLLYYLLGNLDSSLSYAEQSLQLRRTVGDKEGEANTLGIIGMVYVKRGESQKALDYYEQALPLRRAVGNPRSEAAMLDFMGVAYATLNQPQKALEYHQEALQLGRKVGDRRYEAYTLLNLGHVYSLLAEPANSLESYNQALAILRTVEDGNSSRALVGIATVNSKQGNVSVARSSIEEALSLIEAVRAGASDQKLRASYFASQQDAYKLYIDLLMQQHRLRPTGGHDAEALQASERARARSLVELLNEAHVDIRQGVDEALIERERNLIQRLNAKAQRQIQLLGQKSNKEQLEELIKEIRAIEDEYSQVQASIRSASPSYAALTQPQPLSLKELQQQLDPDTLLLEYSLGKDQSYLWVVSKSGLQSYELANREQIEKYAREVYSLLTSRSAPVSGETASQKQKRIVAADARLPAVSAELSQLILGPVAAELEGKRLVIVADGALQFIPFAALPAPNKTAAATNNEYRALILDHEMISLPSVSALAVQRKTLLHRKPAANAVAVIADPVFSLSDDRFKARSRNNEPRLDASAAANTRLLEHMAEDGKLKIRRLPFTRQEADRILAVAPKAGNLKATDFKANRSIATGPELSKYRYVHFATHGYLDSERPDLSAIVLSLVDREGHPQDGFLRAHEIYNLSLPAELVVLSACQTGLGKEIKGEGLVGLTQGFMYAGARRVVVSLWNVNDKATAELMQRLYSSMLKENQSPSAALRKAQAEMSQQKQWEQPYYWAAFVLQGEWN